MELVKKIKKTGRKQNILPVDCILNGTKRLMFFICVLEKQFYFRYEFD
jgi:hypothetical protein